MFYYDFMKLTVTAVQMSNTIYTGHMWINAFSATYTTIAVNARNICITPKAMADRWPYFSYLTRPVKTRS